MNDSAQTRLGPGPSVLRIGRAEDNDAVVDDGLVSRYHVEVRRSPQGWEVRDLGSRNGTILSGVQVRSAVARIGDTLRIGRTEFVIGPEGPRFPGSPVRAPGDAAELGALDGASAVDGIVVMPAYPPIPEESPRDPRQTSATRPLPGSEPIHRIRIPDSMGVGVPYLVSGFRLGELLLYPGRWEYVDSHGRLIASGSLQEISGVKARRSGGVEITLTPKDGKKRWLGHGGPSTPSDVENMIDNARRAGASGETPLLVKQQDPSTGRLIEEPGKQDGHPPVVVSDGIPLHGRTQSASGPETNGTAAPAGLRTVDPWLVRGVAVGAGLLLAVGMTGIGRTGGSGSGAGGEQTVAHWPDGSRSDWGDSDLSLWQPWHMDEARSHWYPNQAEICRIVTQDGPGTVLSSTADFYEGIGMYFGYDAAAIGTAVSVLAVDHCPTARANVR